MLIMKNGEFCMNEKFIQLVNPLSIDDETIEEQMRNLGVFVGVADHNANLALDRVAALEKRVNDDLGLKQRERLRDLIKTLCEQSAVLFTVSEIIDDLDLDDPDDLDLDDSDDELANIDNLCFQANEAIEAVIEILERRLADLEKRLTEEAA